MVYSVVFNSFLFGLLSFIIFISNRLENRQIANTSTSYPYGFITLHLLTLLLLNMIRTFTDT